MQVEPNKFDDEFMDKAWQQMAVILDKEMPVKKRRRFLWIWFLLGFGILVGAGIVYRMNTPLHQEPRKKEINNAVVIPTEQAQLNVLKENLKNSIIKNNQTSFNRIRPNNYVGNQQINGDLLSSFISKTLVKESENLSQITADTIQQFITAKETVVTKEQEITDFIPDVVIPLSSDSIKPIFFSKNEYSIATSINKARKNNFQYGINTGMYYASNQQNGMFGELFIKYKLAQKWQINVGSNYFQPIHLSIAASDEAAAMDSSSARGSLTTSSNEQDTKESKEFLMNNDYAFVQFPLQLEYKLSNRWYIASGLAWTIPLERKKNQNQLQEHFSSNPTISNELITPSPYLSWMLGTHYQFHPKWGMQLQYQHNLTGYQNSLLLGGINYRLGR